MPEQRIEAAALVIEGLGQRLTEHNAAQKLAEDKGRALVDAFKVFCGMHGLPVQTRLMGVADGVVVVVTPDSATAPEPENASG